MSLYRPKQRQQLPNGSIAQLGEHLPYKQRVIGSSPIVPTTFGPVVQLVRTLACHARGRRFEPVPGRQFFASVAQSVEQGTENPRVDGSIPSGGTKVKSVEKCCVYQYFSALFSFFRAFCERRKPENKNIYLYSFVLRCTLFFGDSNTVRHTRFSEFHQCSWFFIRKGRFRGIFLQILLIAQSETLFPTNFLTTIALMDFWKT